ncbi:phage tail tape measure protein [Desulfobacter vibrioformis]|uniref:phage tail tape measure protein n=1 Tax=Desulfobacter vibrioformis TaxID=34031 RepID=UPI00069117FF|nr:phage tail tape measure protein [Desulfobacter vibrioformis]
MTKTNDAITVRLEVDKGNAATVIRQFGADVAKSGKTAEKSMSGLGDEINQSMAGGRKDVQEFENTVKQAGKSGKGAFDEIANSSKRANQSMGQSVSRAKSLVSSITGLGAISFGGGLAAAAVAAVKTGMSYETQMKTVQGVSRASAEEFARLDTMAKTMGETTEWSASQAAQALQYMAMAGYTVDQQISALPGLLNLATAAGMDLGQASDIVTDSLTAMGMGVDELARFNDVLIGTTTRSNTNLSLMGETLKFSAPIAKQYGVNIESLAALIGTLANAGIKGSDAGTDLRQAMINNAKAAKELGTQETDLIGTLKAAKEAGWGVNEVTDKYGLIASKSVLVLMDQITNYERLANQLNDVRGEAQALADIKMDTLSGDIKILKSTIEGLALSISGDTNSSLRGSVQELTRTIRDNKDSIISLFTGIVTAGTEAVKTISQVTRSAELMGATFAASHVSFWDWLSMTPEQAEQFQADIADGTAFLKDKLHDVREEITGFQEKIKQAEGTNQLIWSDEQVAVFQEKVSKLKSQEEEILESIKNIKTATKVDNIDWIGIPTIPTIPAGISTVSNAPIDTDTEKLAAKQAQAWQTAYSSMNTITQAVYDKMLTYYAQDYEANLKLLRDKETAQAIYARKVDALNNKMYGSRVDTALGSFFGEIDDEAKQYSQLMDEGVRVTARVRTEAEKLGDELKRLDKMRNIKAIDQETYDRAVTQQASVGFTQAPGAGYSGDEASALNAQAQELESWYSQQMTLLEQYRQERSDLNAMWDQREAQIKQQHEDRLAQIEQSRYKLALSSASSMFGSMADMIGSYAGEQSAAYKAMFTASKIFTLAQASLNMWDAISDVGATGVTFADKMAAMAAMASAMGGVISSISAVGMAHDGIDRVPKSGTWLLDEGERVLTSETSHKLDKVLSNIQNSMETVKKSQSANTSQSSSSTSINIINTLDPSVLGEYLATSSGQNAILNVLSSRAQAVKRIVR